MFEKAVVRSPLLLGDGGGTDSKNASTSSAAAKTLPDLSRFELPVDLTTRTDIAKTLSQEKQRVNKQKLKKEYLMGDDDNHAEKKQNQVCAIFYNMNNIIVYNQEPGRHPVKSRLPFGYLGVFKEFFLLIQRKLYLFLKFS